MVLRLCVAALIGSSLTLLPIPPWRGADSAPHLTNTDEAGGYGLASLRSAVKAHEGEHADESMIGSVPWQHLPLILIIGLAMGSGVYLINSHLKRTG